MNYSNEFHRLIEDCKQNKQYVGLGNPNAKILFIGKETGVDIGTQLYHGMGESWLEKKFDYSSRFRPTEAQLCDGKHTWQKYQKLFELIISEQLDNNNIKAKDEDYEITFVENVFTSELSNLAAPNTRDAKKNKEFSSALKERKESFWKNEFIKQFPIVFIFASDNKYIETYQGEVCELFDVKFYEQRTAKQDKYWIHYAEEGMHQVYPKLLIHTRQLTNGASNDLINDLAEVAKQFIKEHSINIKVN